MPGLPSIRPQRPNGTTENLTADVSAATLKRAASNYVGVGRRGQTRQDSTSHGRFLSPAAVALPRLSAVPEDPVAAGRNTLPAPARTGPHHSRSLAPIVAASWNG